LVSRPLVQIQLRSIVARDKACLDVFWRQDKSLDNLPEPDMLALEIIDNIEAG
jgi:type I restriction enzyme M protein